nr:hypothetical protein [Lachnospiraceae bacterium]
MNTKVKKGFSLLLVFAMMVSVLSGVSIPAKAAEGKGLVSPEIITETTKEIHVSLESIPSMGSLRVIELNPEEAYEEEKLFTGYKSLGAAFVQHSEEKEVTLNLDEAPTPGKKLCVVLRDIEGYGVYKDYILKETIVKSTKKTKDEILNECKVTILKDGEERKDAFAPEEHSVDVSVKLEESIPSCYLTIYAYPGNVTFDPDTTGNIRLGSAYVKDGDKKTINFNDSYKNVKPGYRIIASLNVCLDTETDFYRPSNSKSYEVVDENGEGFQDYDYPDATIDETELEEGMTSLHISLTGDARIFDAAKEEKTNICYSVGMYPEDENFDFEGENQIALVTRQETTEAFSHREVTFDKPLKAGYRVRVVVYWEQNIDIFLPKGNDYEQCFHMPDDSVLVKGSLKPVISLETGIKDNATSIKGMVKGKVPENSMIFVK